MSILEDSLKHFFFAEAKSNHFTPRCACAARGKYDFKEVAMSLFSSERTLGWKAGIYIIGPLLFVVYVAMRSSLGHQPTRNQSS